MAKKRSQSKKARDKAETEKEEQKKQFTPKKKTTKKSTQKEKTKTESSKKTSATKGAKKSSEKKASTKKTDTKKKTEAARKNVKKDADTEAEKEQDELVIDTVLADSEEQKKSKKKQHSTSKEEKADDKEIVEESDIEATEDRGKDSDDEEKSFPWLVAVVLVAIVILVGGGWYVMSIMNAPVEEGEKRPGFELFDDEEDEEEEEEIITHLPRQIDGVIVEVGKENPVLSCVMIENLASTSVRPQKGLLNASVVYEVIVEGGITRFMAVFANDADHEVGPVRSARDTYLEFASEYNCQYTHAGGSYTAMNAIPRFGMRDLDGLREAGYFWRDSSRYAPHNLFTNREKLRESIVNHGWANEAPPTYDSWLFVQEDEELAAYIPEEFLPLEDQIEATAETVVSDSEEENADESTVEESVSEEVTIDENAVSELTIAFGGSYDSKYVYNTETTVYERYNGGYLQTDATNGEILATKNIVVQYVEAGIPIQGKGRINWPVTGVGPVDIFHEGRKYSGTWKKTDRESRTQYYFDNGDEIPLLPGNTWVTIVPPHIGVTEQ